MYLWIKKRKIFCNLVSLIIVFTFIITFVVNDAVASEILFVENGNTMGQEVPLNIETFLLPHYLGNITRKYKGNNGKTVFHIQDAHCNKFAQHKIGEIIDHLINEYDIELINLEGGAGEYDLGVFENIQKKETKKKVADYFLNTGEINGAEYFAITNPEKTTLWGVENRELYKKNLETYRESLGHKDKVDSYLKYLSESLNNLKTHIYSDKLVALDTEYNRYKSGETNFKDYLIFLVTKAKDNAFELKGYPNISLLYKALIKEKDVDFKKADIEKGILIDELEKRLSKYGRRMLAEKSIEFKNKRIEQEAFYTFLLKKAKEVGIDVESFPGLQGYLSYVGLYEEADKYAVSKEMDNLGNRIKNQLFENEKQKKLNDLSEILIIIKNIFSIELEKSDYEYYAENKEHFKIRTFLEFIEQNSSIYKINEKPKEGIQDFDKYLKDITKFYEYSFERDAAFVENIKFETPSKEKVVRKKPQATIIVTGGFHTDNLYDLFKQRGFSWVSIMPRFECEENYVCPYYSLLAGKPMGRRKKLISAIAATGMLAIVSELCPALADVGFSKEEQYAFKCAVVIQKIMAEKEEGVRIEIITKNGTPIIFGEKDAQITQKITLTELFDRAGLSGKEGIVAEYNGEKFILANDEIKLRDELRGANVSEEAISMLLYNNGGYFYHVTVDEVGRFVYRKAAGNFNYTDTGRFDYDGKEGRRFSSEIGAQYIDRVKSYWANGLVRPNEKPLTATVCFRIPVRTVIDNLIESRTWVRVKKGTELRGIESAEIEIGGYIPVSDVEVYEFDISQSGEKNYSEVEALVIDSFSPRLKKSLISDGGLPEVNKESVKSSWGKLGKRYKGTQIDMQQLLKIFTGTTAILSGLEIESDAKVLLDENMPVDMADALRMPLKIAVVLLTYPVNSNDPDIKRMAEKAQELFRGEDTTIKFTVGNLTSVTQRLAQKDRSGYMREMATKGEARAMVSQLSENQYLIIYDRAMLGKGLAGLVTGLAHEVVGHMSFSPEEVKGLSPIEEEALVFNAEIKYLEALFKDTGFRRQFSGQSEYILTELQRMIDSEKRILDYLKQQDSLQKTKEKEIITEKSGFWSRLLPSAAAGASLTGIGALVWWHFQRKKRILEEKQQVILLLENAFDTVRQKGFFKGLDKSLQDKLLNKYFDEGKIKNNLLNKTGLSGKERNQVKGLLAKKWGTNKTKAVKWKENFMAFTFFGLLSGVVMLLNFGGVVSIPIFLQQVIGIGAVLLGLQTLKASRIQRETGREEAAQPEDTFGQIISRFGVLVGSLVYIHELSHRFFRGKIPRVIDEALAYMAEYFSAIGVMYAFAISPTYAAVAAFTLFLLMAVKFKTPVSISEDMDFIKRLNEIVRGMPVRSFKERITWVLMKIGPETKLFDKMLDQETALLKTYLDEMRIVAVFEERPLKKYFEDNNVPEFIEDNMLEFKNAICGYSFPLDDHDAGVLRGIIEKTQTVEVFKKALEEQIFSEKINRITKNNTALLLAHIVGKDKLIDLIKADGVDDESRLILVRSLGSKLGTVETEDLFGQKDYEYQRKLISVIKRFIISKKYKSYVEEVVRKIKDPDLTKELFDAIWRKADPSNGSQLALILSSNSSIASEYGEKFRKIAKENLKKINRKNADLLMRNSVKILGNLRNSKDLPFLLSVYNNLQKQKNTRDDMLEKELIITLIKIGDMDTFNSVVKPYIEGRKGEPDIFYELIKANKPEYLDYAVFGMLLKGGIKTDARIYSEILPQMKKHKRRNEVIQWLQKQIKESTKTRYNEETVQILNVLPSFGKEGVDVFMDVIFDEDLYSDAVSTASMRSVFSGIKDEMNYFSEKFAEKNIKGQTVYWTTSEFQNVIAKSKNNNLIDKLGEAIIGRYIIAKRNNEETIESAQLSMISFFGSVGKKELFKLVEGYAEEERKIIVNGIYLEPIILLLVSEISPETDPEFRKEILLQYLLIKSGEYISVETYVDRIKALSWEDLVAEVMNFDPEMKLGINKYGKLINDDLFIKIYDRLSDSAKENYFLTQHTSSSVLHMAIDYCLKEPAFEKKPGLIKAIESGFRKLKKKDKEDIKNFIEKRIKELQQKYEPGRTEAGILFLLSLGKGVGVEAGDIIDSESSPGIFDYAFGVLSHKPSEGSYAYEFCVAYMVRKITTSDISDFHENFKRLYLLAAKSGGMEKQIGTRLAEVNLPDEELLKVLKSWSEEEKREFLIKHNTEEYPTLIKLIRIMQSNDISSILDFIKNPEFLAYDKYKEFSPDMVNSIVEIILENNINSPEKIRQITEDPYIKERMTGETKLAVKLLIKNKDHKALELTVQDKEKIYAGEMSGVEENYYLKAAEQFNEQYVPVVFGYEAEKYISMFLSAIKSGKYGMLIGLTQFLEYVNTADPLIRDLIGNNKEFIIGTVVEIFPKLILEKRYYDRQKTEILDNIYRLFYDLKSEDLFSIIKYLSVDKQREFVHNSWVEFIGSRKDKNSPSILEKMISKEEDIGGVYPFMYEYLGKNKVGKNDFSMKQAMVEKLQQKTSIENKLKTYSLFIEMFPGQLNEDAGWSPDQIYACKKSFQADTGQIEEYYKNLSNDTKLRLLAMKLYLIGKTIFGEGLDAAELKDYMGHMEYMIKMGAKMDAKVDSELNKLLLADFTQLCMTGQIKFETIVSILDAETASGDGTIPYIIKKLLEKIPAENLFFSDIKSFSNLIRIYLELRNKLGTETGKMLETKLIGIYNKQNNMFASKFKVSLDAGELNDYSLFIIKMFFYEKNSLKYLIENKMDNTSENAGLMGQVFREVKEILDGEKEPEYDLVDVEDISKDVWRKLLEKTIAFIESFDMEKVLSLKNPEELVFAYNDAYMALFAIAKSHPELFADEDMKERLSGLFIDKFLMFNKDREINKILEKKQLRTESIAMLLEQEAALISIGNSDPETVVPVLMDFLGEDMQEGREFTIINKVLARLAEKNAAKMAEIVGTRVFVIRYLKEHSEMFRRLNEKEFVRDLNNIMTVFGQEKTVHHSESRVGEDEKLTIIGYLMGKKDLKREVDIFNKYFKNDPSEYSMDLKDIDALSELLKYISLEKFWYLLKAIENDPRKSVETVIEMIKTKILDLDIGGVNMDYLLKRLNWVISNFYILENAHSPLRRLLKKFEENNKGKDDINKLFINMLRELEASGEYSDILAISKKEQYGKMPLDLLVEAKLKAISNKDLPGFVASVIFDDTVKGDKILKMIKNTSLKMKSYDQEKLLILLASGQEDASGISILRAIIGDTEIENLGGLKKYLVEETSGYNQNIWRDMVLETFITLAGKTENRKVLQNILLRSDMTDIELVQLFKDFVRLESYEDIAKTKDLKKKKIKEKDVKDVLGVIKQEKKITPKILHIFYEHLLDISYDEEKDYYDTEALDLFESLFLNKKVLDSTYLKGKLLQQIIEFNNLFKASEDRDPEINRKLGAMKTSIFEGALKYIAVNDGRKTSQKNQKEQYTLTSKKKAVVIAQKLIFILDAFAAEIVPTWEVLNSEDKDIYQDLTKTIKDLVKGLLHGITGLNEGLLSEGKIKLRNFLDLSNRGVELNYTDYDFNEDAYNELRKMLADFKVIVIYNMLMRIKDIDGDSDEGKEIFEDIKKYAISDKFRRLDYRGDNIFRLLELYFNKNSEKLSVQRNMADAFIAEAKGEFNEFKYSSSDYIKGFDAFIQSKLSDTQQELLAKKEGETLLDKIQDEEELTDINSQVNAIKEAWENNFKLLSTLEGEGYSVVFTDDFFDLVNAGNFDGAGSCQDVRGGGYNSGLVGYVNKGINKAIMVKDSQGKILSRRIVRLLMRKNEDGSIGPVLFVESLYGGKHSDELTAGILKLAENLNASGFSVPIIAKDDIRSSHINARKERADIVFYKGINRRNKPVPYDDDYILTDYSDAYGYSFPGSVGLYTITEDNKRIQNVPIFNFYDSPGDIQAVLNSENLRAIEPKKKPKKKKSEKEIKPKSEKGAEIKTAHDLSRIGKDITEADLKKYLGQIMPDLKKGLDISQEALIEKGVDPDDAAKIISIIYPDRAGPQEKKVSTSGTVVKALAFAPLATFMVKTIDSFLNPALAAGRDSLLKESVNFTGIFSWNLMMGGLAVAGIVAVGYLVYSMWEIPEKRVQPKIGGKELRNTIRSIREGFTEIFNPGVERWIARNNKKLDAELNKYKKKGYHKYILDIQKKVISEIKKLTATAQNFPFIKDTKWSIKTDIKSQNKAVIDVIIKNKNVSDIQQNYYIVLDAKVGRVTVYDPDRKQEGDENGREISSFLFRDIDEHMLLDLNRNMVSVVEVNKLAGTILYKMNRSGEDINTAFSKKEKRIILDVYGRDDNIPGWKNIDVLADRAIAAIDYELHGGRKRANIGRILQELRNREAGDGEADNIIDIQKRYKNLTVLDVVKIWLEVKEIFRDILGRDPDVNEVTHIWYKSDYDPEKVTETAKADAVSKKSEKEQTVQEPRVRKPVRKLTDEEKDTISKAQNAVTVISRVNKNVVDIVVTPTWKITAKTPKAKINGDIKDLFEGEGMYNKLFTMNYDYFSDSIEDYVKSIKRVLPKVIKQIISSKEREEPRALLYVPADMQTKTEEILDQYLKNTDNQDLRNLIVVVAEEGLSSDTELDQVNHVVLGRGLLSYRRLIEMKQPDPDTEKDLRMTIARYINSITANPDAVDLSDPDIIKQIIDGLAFLPLIAPITGNWREEQEAALEVMRSL